MNWIERGFIEDSDGPASVERTRAVAAMVLVSELVVFYWLSAALVLNIPTGAEGGRNAGQAFSVTPLVLWPADRPDSTSSQVTPPTDEYPTQENVGTAEENSTGPAIAGELGDVNAGPDDIRIVSITPPSTIPIWVGDVVNFQVTVEYNLASASSSSLQLVFEECSCEPKDAGPLPLDFSAPAKKPDAFELTASSIVERGRKTQVLTKRVRVPVAEALTISVHLGEPGAAQNPSDGRLYRVIDPGKPAVGAQNTLKITFVQPAAGTVLRVGDVVNFEAVVEYNLIRDTDTLQLSIGGIGLKPIVESFEKIKKGQRHFKFNERVEIPKAVSESAELTLAVGLAGSTAGETVVYKVAPK
jgi:hypothetical protein